MFYVEGDAVAMIFASIFGGTGLTTYAENIAVLAVNKVYSTLNFLFTCLFAFILSMSPKFGAILYSIPSGVLGGLSVVLFGTITATGVKMCMDSDLSSTRNLIVMATTLSLSAGLASGPAVIIGPMEFDGLGFSSIVCVLMYLFLARIPDSVFDYLNTSNSKIHSNEVELESTVVENP